MTVQDPSVLFKAPLVVRDKLNTSKYPHVEVEVRASDVRLGVGWSPGNSFPTTPDAAPPRPDSRPLPGGTPSTFGEESRRPYPYPGDRLVARPYGSLLPCGSFQSFVSTEVWKSLGSPV